MEHIPWMFARHGEKAKQNSARYNAKCSKCFQFLCNNSDRTWFLNALTFARSLGRCWKPRPPASVFNTYLGTWRMLMHEKPYLIPIIKIGVSVLLRLFIWQLCSVQGCIRSIWRGTRHHYILQYEVESDILIELPRWVGVGATSYNKMKKTISSTSNLQKVVSSLIHTLSLFYFLS